MQPGDVPATYADVADLRGRRGVCARAPRWRWVFGSFVAWYRDLLQDLTEKHQNEPETTDGGGGGAGLRRPAAGDRVREAACHIGYDLSEHKVRHYRARRDPTQEVPAEEFAASTGCRFTTDPRACRAPMSSSWRCRRRSTRRIEPDFSPLISASEIVGRQPEAAAPSWCTNRPCTRARPRKCACRCSSAARAALEARLLRRLLARSASIPGDKQHTLPRIVKVVAGDTPETLETGSPRSTARSCPPACTGPARSGSPRRPR